MIIFFISNEVKKYLIIYFIVLIINFYNLSIILNMTPKRSMEFQFKVKMTKI